MDSSQITVRPAIDSEFVEIKDIARECGIEIDYHISELEELQKSKSTSIIVAENDHDKKIVGFAILRKMSSSFMATWLMKIDVIAVIPDKAWCQGIEDSLMTYMKNKLSPYGIESIYISFNFRDKDTLTFLLKHDFELWSPLEYALNNEDYLFIYTIPVYEPKNKPANGE